MGFKDLWGMPGCGAALLPINGPLSRLIFFMDNSRISWLRQRGAAGHAVYSDTVLAIFRMFFPLPCRI